MQKCFETYTMVGDASQFLAIRHYFLLKTFNSCSRPLYHAEDLHLLQQAVISC